jgi:predicted nucleic acid-binding protein
VSQSDLEATAPRRLLIRIIGDLDLARRYEALLTRSRGLRTVEIDRDQLEAAALLRAKYRPRTPDAIQIGAALSRGGKTFVANDRDLPEIPGLKIIQMRDYLARWPPGGILIPS